MEKESNNEESDEKRKEMIHGFRLDQICIL